MKKGKIALMGLLLIGLVSCKKAEKIEKQQEPKPTITVKTISGGSLGFANGLATDATYRRPMGIVCDKLDNLFIVDQVNHCIRKMTPEGIVSTFVGMVGASGYADGTGAAAQFNYPCGLTIDSDDNLYVADGENHCIRKITPAGVVSTFAGTAGTAGYVDGTGTSAQFNWGGRYGIADMCMDASNNLYLPDGSNNRIRKITPSGVVTTFAGNGNRSTSNGPIATAGIKIPQGIAIDKKTGVMYFTVSGNHCIQKISTDGMISTYAGSIDDVKSTPHLQDGIAAGSTFFWPGGLEVDTKGNLYVADMLNQVIRVITPDKIVSSIGEFYNDNNYQFILTVDGDASKAKFFWPGYIAFNKAGDFYVTQTNPQYATYIRKIIFELLPETKSLDQIEIENWNKPNGWK